MSLGICHGSFQRYFLRSVAKDHDICDHSDGDEGGLPEITLDGETGAVLPPGDVDRCAEGLRRYLGDRELRAAHGAAGRAHTTATFTAERMKAAFVELLAGKLAAAPGPQVPGPGS